MDEKIDVMRLFESCRPLKVVAPMVRYSKLPFRLLCYKYGADLCFTPMIVAESFNLSQAARDNDRPLVVQFGAKDPVHFGLAAQKVSRIADVVDLNCGCPQKWAMAEGMGSALLKNPQLIKEMVRSAKELGGLPTSIKIRIDEDIRKTLELVRVAEDAGVCWITVHGRTYKERTRVPVHLDAQRMVKEHARVPIIANGDAFSLADIERIAAETGVDGVMSARGALANPAMFAGYETCPIEAAVLYIRLALEYGGPYGIHHHHLLYMLYSALCPAERAHFRQLPSLLACVAFFRARGWWPSDSTSASASTFTSTITASSASVCPDPLASHSTTASRCVSTSSEATDFKSEVTPECKSFDAALPTPPPAADADAEAGTYTGTYRGLYRHVLHGAVDGCYARGWLASTSSICVPARERLETSTRASLLWPMSTAMSTAVCNPFADLLPPEAIVRWDQEC